MQIMSGLRAPVINDVATLGAWDLQFPLSPSIGPVPEGQSRPQRGNGAFLGGFPTPRLQGCKHFRTNPSNDSRGSGNAWIGPGHVLWVLLAVCTWFVAAAFRPIIEKTWGSKLASHQFPAQLDLAAAWEASVDTASRMGWQLKHVDRCRGQHTTAIYFLAASLINRDSRLWQPTCPPFRETVLIELVCAITCLKGLQGYTRKNLQSIIETASLGLAPFSAFSGTAAAV